MPWLQNQGYDRYPDTTRPSLFAAGEDDWDMTHTAPVFQTNTEGSGSRSYEDFLRARMQNQNQSRSWDGQRGGYNRFSYGEDVEEGSTMARRGVQIVGSIALIGLLYVAFHSQASFAQKVQAYVRQEMNADTNLSAISSWWKQNVSGKVALPTLSTGVSGTNTNSNTSTNTTDTSKKVKFALPVSDATVKTAFDGKDQQGITFSASSGADVHPAASGVVEKVEQEGTADFMVTINHGTSGKTIYRHLATVSVKADAWLQPEQTIGTLSKTDPAEFFFAYQKDGAYVNPADVLNLAGK
jgi:murein DD-endopeptidase MepM/ murein hydrolase activator NlpD